MNINILTPEQIKGIRHTGPHGCNSVYDRFLRPIVEGRVPGISFHYKDAGYASSQSAYKTVKSYITRNYAKGLIEVCSRGDMVYVYAVAPNNEEEPDKDEDWDL